MFQFRCGEQQFWTCGETLSKSTVLDGKVEIDRNGDLFPYILDHLRGYPVDLSSNVDVKRLLCDARFYDLVELQEQCLEKLDKVQVEQAKREKETQIKRPKIRGPSNDPKMTFDQVFPELLSQLGAKSMPEDKVDPTLRLQPPREKNEKKYAPKPRMMRTTGSRPTKLAMRKQSRKPKKQRDKRDDSEEIVEMLRSFAHGEQGLYTPRPSTDPASISTLPTPHFHKDEYVAMRNVVARPTELAMQPPGALLFQMQPFLNMMQRDE